MTSSAGFLDCLRARCCCCCSVREVLPLALLLWLVGATSAAGTTPFPFTICNPLEEATTSVGLILLCVPVLAFCVGGEGCCGCVCLPDSPSAADSIPFAVTLLLLDGLTRLDVVTDLLIPMPVLLFSGNSSELKLGEYYSNVRNYKSESAAHLICGAETDRDVDPPSLGVVAVEVDEDVTDPVFTL